MSTYRRFQAEECPSLVTTNTAHRRALFGAEAAARLFMEVLDEVRLETIFRLLAFVVMPDHVHLVLIPSMSCSLGEFMQLLKGRFSRRYNGVTGGSGTLWQSRYHERSLRSESELVAAIEYVHLNPVTAGLVEEASAYPWSSARGEYSTDLLVCLGQAKA
jgi:putative transposase